MRIFLIDDDVTVIENLTLFLRNEFHTVDSLTYIKDRLTLEAKLIQFAPDGIVLDYGMEVLGTEIYSWIREWKRELPIVFYTNFARSQEKINMLNIGAKENQIVEKREVGLDLDLILTALRSKG